MDLQNLTPEEFEGELARRIDRVQAALDALRATFGQALEGASLPTSSAAEDQRLWREMEDAEQGLELAWSELARRREARIGEAPGR